MKLVRWLTLCLAFLAVAAVAAPAPVLNKDYKLINPPQPTETGNKVEVIEFFFYGCPHCYALQPTLETWLKQKPKDVEFRRVAVALTESWLPMTRAFWTLDALGLSDRLHRQVFNAIHEENVVLSDPQTLFDWMAKHGVDRKKFTDAYNSFAVQNKVQRSMQYGRLYGITGTPAVAVDGRYLTSPSMVGNGDRFIEVLNGLVDTARRERAKKA